MAYFNEDNVTEQMCIAVAKEAGLIKPADIETASKKYMSYIPYYG